MTLSRNTIEEFTKAKLMRIFDDYLFEPADDLTQMFIRNELIDYLGELNTLTEIEKSDIKMALDEGRFGVEIKLPNDENMIKVFVMWVVKSE